MSASLRAGWGQALSGLFAVGKLDPLAEFKLLVNEISESGRQVFTLNEMWPQWKTHPA
jgi:hypothetical protein